ncbi:hypothetical protein EW146_g6665 [Bondarzewia mesenterica]|uniref:CCHC-type domain-containing protein n=1 Tax=Bondarzewia mesenterica TaxID=1095465 RepID=A0A4S4LTK2_9AGAM|nr:hypothetical protein EW146_g6665 [Bondarzewia mesenterica]
MPAFLTWVFPGATWFHHQLIPSNDLVPSSLDARTTMLVWQLGNCYLLLGLLSSLVFRAVRDALPTNPSAQERILGASLLALAIADVTHIGATFIGLPEDIKYSPQIWNATTHGNISFVIVLLTFRVAWFLGIGRQTYYYGKASEGEKGKKLYHRSGKAGHTYTMSPPNDVEIIDLTSSPEAAEHSEKARKKKTKRRKRKESQEDEVIEISEDVWVEQAAKPAQTRTNEVKLNKRAANEAGDRRDDTKENREQGSRRDRRRKKAESSSRPQDQNAGPVADDSVFFFIDVTPAQVPAKYTIQDPGPSTNVPEPARTTVPDSAADPAKLLLPAHVSVIEADDGTTVEIIRPPESDSDSESYIEYLDYDDRAAPGTERYFHEPKEDTKQSRFVCKKCGAENEHRTWDCTVLICMTCGVRDEHPTRGCPVRLPSQGLADRNRISFQECRTHWRLYQYVTDGEREVTLRIREEKRSLGVGKGGEGYIARDAWCYNCGAAGHLGDDCNTAPHPSDFPIEPSAFSLYNTMSGPFFDPTTRPDQSIAYHREPRDWENADTLADGWGFDAPVNVGKQGRNKDRARMEQQARKAQDEEDDPDDWFRNARNVRNRGVQPANPSTRNGQASKKISFGSSVKDGGRRANPDEPARSRQPGEERSQGNGRSRKDRKRDSDPPPSFPDRTQDEPGELHIRGAGKRKSDSRDDDRGYRDRDRGYRDRDRDKRRDYERDYERSRGWGRERERERESSGYRRDDRGPRYKGGYPS